MLFRSIKNSELPNSLTTNFLKIIDITDSVTYLKGITNIFVLDHQTLKLKPIYYAEHNLILNDVCIDSIGNFWLATNRGLKHYNANTQEIEAYTTNLFSEPKSVVYTPGKIWIGANNMLFAYSIDDKEYTVFDESDGALPNEYLSTSNYIAENGDIYMCGAAGLLRIGKDYPFEIDESLSIELMDVVLNGAVVTNKVTSSGHITIPYNHTSLTIKTINNADDVFRKRLYRFHVSGLSQVIETYSPTYTLYALPPGTHTIKVSNSQRDGKWSTPKQILTVTVQTA